MTAAERPASASLIDLFMFPSKDLSRVVAAFLASGVPNGMNLVKSIG
jgi:phage terminase large subunit-like protein